MYSCRVVVQPALFNIGQAMKIIQQDFSGRRIKVERGTTAGWGNTTGSTADTHSSGASISICRHSIGHEQMGDPLGTSALFNDYQEHQIPLTPITIKGDAITHSGSSPNSGFLGKIELGFISRDT